MFLKRKKNVEENIDSEPIVNEDEVSASKLLHGDDDEAEAVPGSGGLRAGGRRLFPD